MTSSEEETCAICLNEFDDDESVYTIPECGHKFHTNCALRWYRSTNQTNCPLCRSMPDFFGISLGSRDGRIKLWKRLGRRKSCPKEVKKALDKLKSATENHKEANRAFAQFKRDHKELWKEFAKLRNARWSKWRLVSRAERQVDALPTLILMRELLG